MKKELIFKKSKFTKEEAVAFTNAASGFKSDILLYHNNKKVNAKSLMGVLAVSLSLVKEDAVMLTAEGADESAALTALCKFFI
ncbi:MAG: HPr family phosphocarrier protein [Clostridiales bacterium]|jgi:phosphotransferase system HPr (HPr) family protein|nr:HPr family phosphocarrier protein [Clostridiales bacterium]